MKRFTILKPRVKSRCAFRECCGVLIGVYRLSK